MTRTGLGSILLLLATATVLAAPCSPSSTALCLSSGRFEVQVAWKDFQNNTGNGQAVRLTADTGYFWFFGASNVELVVKVLDARAYNGHFWVFYGALTNVEYEMTVRDTVTEDLQIYSNPSGRFGSVGDTLAFPPDSGSLALASASRALAPVGKPIDESAIRESVWEARAACSPGATALCLAGGRFRVEAAWTDFQGNTGAGQAVGLTGDTGYFWFFGSSNVEVVIKVLDGRALDDHFWVFYGALSNVEYTLTVTDTVTGIVKKYANTSGLFASVGDTLAFGKPTTFELIDGAVVKGEISEETALLDKVYAMFGDARLPQAYVGDPSGEQGHGIFTDIVARWSTLSPATQQGLEPFLVPPIYSESWFGRSAAARSPSLERPDSILAAWTRIETARAAVWYRATDPGAQDAAGNLAAEIENVWTTEKALMGREPLSDAGKSNNGGDGKLDIYVIPSFRTPDPDDKPDGLTPAYRDGLDYLPGGDPPNVERAAYMLIRLSAASTPEGARAVLAHEFFHAIAWNQKYGAGILASRWLNEATATWMEDYVYPTQIRNEEHIAAGRYLTDGYREGFDAPPDGGYADYLFLFYLARQMRPELNRDIWNNLTTMPSLQAIDAAIPGGFGQRWHEFALYCWNHPDVDRFERWDGLRGGLVGALAEPYLPLLSANGAGTTLQSRVVPHLAMRYAYIEVLSDKIKRLEIENQSVAGGGANAKTQAWIKFADGTTRTEDWTGKDRVVFCRDRAGQQVTQLMILYTNSATRRPAVWNEGTVIAAESGCGYHGTAHAKRREPDDNETIDVTATFVHIPPDFGGIAFYSAPEFTVRYKGWHIDNNGCEASMVVTRTITGAATALMKFDKNSSPPFYSSASAFGAEGTETIVCRPGGTTTKTGLAAGIWLSVPEGRYQANPDGSLTGTYQKGPWTWTWSFQLDPGEQ